MTAKTKCKEWHVYPSDELYERVVAYKKKHYNGLPAINKVLNDCIEIGLRKLESKEKGGTK